MPPDVQAALTVSAVSHAFAAQRVLRDVSFQVQPGEFTVLLGLNGAGKSTLFAVITRLYHSSAGSIAVLGHDVAAHPLPALARMGVVFQQSTLDLDLTVEQNLYYHAALHGITRRDAAGRIKAGLADIGLADRAGEKIRKLSGGQRRRVELARALLHRPSLLLLDEPTVGLDVESRSWLLAHVHELCRTLGVGVLWATHLIDEAAADDRVIILHDGRILANGMVREIAGNTNLAQAFAVLTRKAA